jgi:signal transduction histidine kinase
VSAPLRLTPPTGADAGLPAEAARNLVRRAVRGGLALRQIAITVVVVLLAVLCAFIAVNTFGPWLFERSFHGHGVVDSHVVDLAKAAYIESARWVVAAAGLTALVASSVLVFLNSRSMISVVTSVRSSATRIAQGDHNVRIGASHMGAEFEALGQAFNTMAEQLREVETTRARLLGDLAHEMRTPLATLDGYLETISDGDEAADAETLAILRQQTARLTRLAADVSLVATVEEGHLSLRRRRLAVGDVVTDACQSALVAYSEAGVALDRQFEDGADRLVIDADPDRIEQVLANLLTNARRHTPPGGHVVVTVRPAGDRGGEVAVEVRDDGEGIDQSHLPHLFERFYRIDSARDRGSGGSGIGLTIVRALVAAHGGTATASSPGLGQGAVFTVTLPTAEH